MAAFSAGVLLGYHATQLWEHLTGDLGTPASGANYGGFVWDDWRSGGWPCSVPSGTDCFRSWQSTALPQGHLLDAQLATSGWGNYHWRHDGTIEDGVIPSVEIAVYRVDFWRKPLARPGTDPERIGYKLDADRITDAPDVHEVLSWAEANAEGRTFVVYVSDERDPNEPGAIRLSGTDPTVPAEP